MNDIKVHHFVPAEQFVANFPQHWTAVHSWLPWTIRISKSFMMGFKGLSIVWDGVVGGVDLAGLVGLDHARGT